MLFSAWLLLTNAIQLYIVREHGDRPILEHVDELIESLKKGIVPTLEDEQNNSGWEDVDGYSNDSDGNVEMS